MVVLADHTKWGLVSLSSFARLSEVDVLITDDMLPADARAVAAEQVGEVVYAESMIASHTHRQAGEASRAARGACNFTCAARAVELSGAVRCGAFMGLVGGDDGFAGGRVVVGGLGGDLFG